MSNNGWSSWLWSTASWAVSRFVPVLTSSASSSFSAAGDDHASYSQTFASQTGGGDGLRYRSSTGGADSASALRLVPHSSSSSINMPLAEAAPAPQRWWLLKRVLHGAGWACFFIVMLYFAQDKLIYHPSSYADDSDYYHRLRLRGVPLPPLPTALRWHAPAHATVAAAAAVLAALDPRLAPSPAAAAATAAGAGAGARAGVRGRGAMEQRLPVVPIPLLADDTLSALALAAAESRVVRAVRGGATVSETASETADTTDDTSIPAPTSVHVPVRVPMVSSSSLRAAGVAYVIPPPLDTPDTPSAAYSSAAHGASSAHEGGSAWDGPEWSPLRGLLPPRFFEEPHAVWVFFTANAQLALDWVPVVSALLGEYSRHAAAAADAATATAAASTSSSETETATAAAPPPRVAVLLVDHPGYGASPGFPSPKSIADAGTRALDSFLALAGARARRPGGWDARVSAGRAEGNTSSKPAIQTLPRARVLTGGFSLGCAAALMLQRTLEASAAAEAAAAVEAAAEAAVAGLESEAAASAGAYDTAAEGIPAGSAPMVLSSSAASFSSASAEEGGALLLAPFTSLLAAARALVFRALPSFMLRHSYDNVAALAAVAAARAGRGAPALPLVVLHGTADGIVPVEQGRALTRPYLAAPDAASATPAEASTGRSGIAAELIEVPGAGHNAVTDAAWPDIVAAFIDLTLGMRRSKGRR